MFTPRTEDAMIQPTLLVLAAGMGSRYGGLKQMDPVGPNEEAIIDYSIHDAKRAGFGKVVFVIRRAFEDAFRRTIAARYADDIPVDLAFQELDANTGGFDVPADRTKPWGTGHAVLVAADTIDGNFAVINADDFYGRQSYDIAAKYPHAHDPQQAADWCMVGYRLANTLSQHGGVSRGVCEIDDDGMLQRIVETHDIRRADGRIIAEDPADANLRITLADTQLVSMNFWAFTPAIFDHLATHFEQFLAAHGRQLKSEFYLPAVVNELVAQNQARVRVLACEQPWVGVTYRDDKPHVQQHIRQLIEAGVYPKTLRPNAGASGEAR